MSDFVVVNEEGDLYGGFDGKPHWFKMKRDDCLMNETTADAVVSQLAVLGYGKCVKRLATEVKRKWVPKNLDAAA